VVPRSFIRRRLVPGSLLTADRAAQVRQQAGKAKRQVLLLGPLLAGVLVCYHHRRQFFGVDEPVRIVTVVFLVAIGWALARDIGRATGPLLMKRMDPGTAGTVGFLIRLVAIVIAVMVALHIAGLTPRTLALGGAFTAVIFGLAAQQTFGNLVAGAVLISARPFRVGDRVRIPAGAIAGVVEGEVRSLGLLYTNVMADADMVMIPNSVVLNCAVVPLRQPNAVDLRARLRPDVRPSDLQLLLDRMITVPTRERAEITLEELDDEELVVRIRAVPLDDEEGGKLADQVLAGVAAVTSGDVTLEHVIAGDGRS
jgi:small-conductance mechanosensitive channel